MSKGMYIICIKSYIIDGIQINKGDIDYYTSKLPLFSDKWRILTPLETSILITK